MKTKIKIYYVLFFLLLTGVMGVKAQMTVGNSEPPHEGALLDLKQPNASTKMGLKLPVVSLADASQYGLTSGDQTKAVGMVVYNDNANIANGHGAGVYVWNGTKWSSLLGTGGSTGEEPTIATVECAGLIFMDRNLGAGLGDPNPATYDAGTNTNPTGYLNGDYYQWGRIADGHEKLYSPVVDGPASSADSGGQVPSSNSTHYGKFITNNTASPYNWIYKLTKDLWNSTDGGSGNPCPSGFRVPSIAEWTVVNDNITAANINAKTSTREGINIGSSNLFLPCAGIRRNIDGTYYTCGAVATYWSSTVTNLSTHDPYGFTYDSGSHYTSASTFRSHGKPVRCVKK